MISVEEALTRILEHTRPLPAGPLPLAKAAHHVLAKGTRSPYHSPPFHQSAMDGYAIRFADLAKYKALTCTSESAAGTATHSRLKAGHAMRIFTGAMVPPGADTVVIQENTSRSGNMVHITDTSLVKKGANIRLKGSQLRNGALALERGSVLHPPAIGYLAMLGIASVNVIAQPRIGIVATGNELQSPGKPLKPGRIYESNTAMLQALLHQMHLSNLSVARVGDHAARMEQVLGKALEKQDVLLVTGGISVGDHDLVAPTLKKLGVKQVFHKVAQKPGKPFYFGTKGRKLVFALPGNPASVLTCFYAYVYPALRALCGHSSPGLRHAQYSLADSYTKKAGLTHFLRGVAADGMVNLLPGQESYQLKTFALANCLVVIPADATEIKAGTPVTVLFLP